MSRASADELIQHRAQFSVCCPQTPLPCRCHAAAALAAARIAGAASVSGNAPSAGHALREAGVAARCSIQSDGPGDPGAERDTYPSRYVISLGAGIAGAHPTGIEHLARHAGLAQSMAQLMRRCARRVRRQLFVPLQVRRQHGSGMEEVFAGKQRKIAARCWISSSAKRGDI